MNIISNLSAFKVGWSGLRKAGQTLTVLYEFLKKRRQTSQEISMKTSFNSLLVATAIALFSSLATAGTTVTYKFTGTLVQSYFGYDKGNTVSGTVTLDPGAVATAIGDFGGGQYGYWQGGQFAIDAVTNTGFALGTASSYGLTQFSTFDFPSFPEGGSNEYQIQSWSYTDFNVLKIDSYSWLPGDGIADVPNPWSPLSFQFQHIRIDTYDAVSGQYVTGIYSIDTWELVPVNILIGGLDTGITDFQYEGTSVSALIAGYATSATNHGDFVSKTQQLAITLQKAGLLTEEQRQQLGKVASNSNVGK